MIHHTELTESHTLNSDCLLDAKSYKFSSPQKESKSKRRRVRPCIHHYGYAPISILFWTYAPVRLCAPSKGNSSVSSYGAFWRGPEFSRKGIGVTRTSLAATGQNRSLLALGAADQCDTQVHAQGPLAGLVGQASAASRAGRVPL